jgi:protocatechuate 3,4-dioxygenase beta subunit
MVVKGVLVDKAGKPLSGWHVQVVECDENGKHNLLGLKPELNEKGEQVSIDGTWIWLGASMGETDKTGLFGVSIPADYFAPGDKAHFVLRLAKELPPHENFSPIMDTKTGSVVVFTVPRSASSFDLTGRPLVVDAR